MSKPFYKELPVTLDKEERDTKACELAAQVETWKRMEDAERDRSKLAKEAIKAAKEEVLKLTRVVTTGIEDRQVPCRRDTNRIRGLYEVVRLDSLEVISTTTMTMEERKREGIDQLVLVPDPNEPAPPPKGKSKAH